MMSVTGGKGREGKGREGKGREGKGREGKSAADSPHFACSSANPWCTWIEDGRPGKRVGSKPWRKASRSVRSARLGGGRRGYIPPSRARRHRWESVEGRLTCGLGSCPDGRR
jgi:hypothetical protein